MWNCLVCRKTFDSAFQLAEHTNVHTHLSPFMCPNCGETFLSITEYIDHAKHFPPHHYFPCLKCKSTLHSQDELSGHQCKESEINVKKKQCPGCKELFTAKNYTLHSKYFVCCQKVTCETCERQFSTQEKLEKHLCFIPKGSDVIWCSCFREFSVHEFKQHLGKHLKCCDCSMEFTVMANLIKHIRTHTKEKPYVCTFCGRGFSQPAHLRNHRTCHLGQSPLKCSQCDFSFKTENGLRKHLKKHEAGLFDGLEVKDLRKKSTGIFSCEICSQQFRFKRNLSMHINKHNRANERSDSPKLCVSCGKMLDNSIALKRHCCLKEKRNKKSIVKN